MKEPVNRVFYGIDSKKEFKKMRVKIMLAFMIILLVSSCASNQGPKIYVNHAPAENFILVLTNPETQITLYSKSVRHYLHKEGEELDTWYEPLPIGEVVKLDDKTKDLSISVRIANEQKVYYSLVHVYTMKIKSESAAFTYEDPIYEGNFSRKDFVVMLNTSEDIEEGRSHIEIRDEEDHPILFSQVVEYRHKRGGGAPIDH